MHVALFVTGGIDGRFGDEGRVRKLCAVQQAAEWLQANLALANVLVTVEF